MTFSRDVQRLELLVEFNAYCLNPNHFHFILQQLVDGGISEFMKRLGGGYTKYFNIKNNRSGSLFQGKFKAIHIKSTDYLDYLSAYINGNAEIHGIAKTTSWKWSSHSEFAKKDKDNALCNTDFILERFSDRKDYDIFLAQVIAESSKRKEEFRC